MKPMLPATGQPADLQQCQIEHTALLVRAAGLGVEPLPYRRRREDRAGVLVAPAAGVQRRQRPHRPARPPPTARRDGTDLAAFLQAPQPRSQVVAEAPGPTLEVGVPTAIKHDLRSAIAWQRRCAQTVASATVSRSRTVGDSLGRPASVTASQASRPATNSPTSSSRAALRAEPRRQQQVEVVGDPGPERSQDAEPTGQVVRSIAARAASDSPSATPNKSARPLPSSRVQSPASSGVMNSDSVGAARRKHSQALRAHTSAGQSTGISRTGRLPRSELPSARR